jgi:hypothetical protein
MEGDIIPKQMLARPLYRPFSLFSTIAHYKASINHRPT